jgi:hypothetical protein
MTSNNAATFFTKVRDMSGKSQKKSEKREYKAQTPIRRLTTGTACTTFSLYQFFGMTKSVKPLRLVSSAGTDTAGSSFVDFSSSSCGIFDFSDSRNFVSTANNALQFLQNDCPPDVLTKVLSYAGPRKIRVLSQTNTYFRDFLLHDEVWRVFSEVFSKVCWSS